MPRPTCFLGMVCGWIRGPSRAKTSEPINREYRLMIPRIPVNDAGLSGIRQGSPSDSQRVEGVHQLLGSDEAREIPRWLSQRRGQEAAASPGHSDFQSGLASELDTIRR